MQHKCASSHLHHAAHREHSSHCTAHVLLLHRFFFPSTIACGGALEFVVAMCEVAAITIRTRTGVAPLRAQTRLAVPRRSVPSSPVVACSSTPATLCERIQRLWRFEQKNTWAQCSKGYSPLTLVSLLLLYLLCYLLLSWRCLISFRACTVAANRTLRIISCNVGARLTGGTSTCVGRGCRDSGSAGTKLFAAMSKIAPIAE